MIELSYGSAIAIGLFIILSILMLVASFIEIYQKYSEIDHKNAEIKSLNYSLDNIKSMNAELIGKLDQSNRMWLMSKVNKSGEDKEE